MSPNAARLSDHQPAGFARAGCGGLTVALNGVSACLRLSGALWLAGERTLVVADLHFEKGSFFAARGQMLPPYDTRETLRRLEAEVSALAPKHLIFLGDSFHDGAGEGRLPFDDRLRLQSLAAGRALTWIVGNHDTDGPSGLPGDVVEAMSLGPLTLRHAPLPAPQAGEVCGHLHPSAKIRGRGRTLRRRCFATDGSRLILPAFGAYTGGLNVLDPAFAGLFPGPLKIAALGEDKVHPISRAALARD